MMARLYIIIITVILKASNSQRINPVVRTSKGLVEGIYVDPNPATGVSYRAFLSIPYGEKPVRFQLPQEKAAWKGILKAHTELPPCPQISVPSYSEDCLHLNVFTPMYSSPNKSLAVMVYIEGGGFTRSYVTIKLRGPDFLISQHVILVSMNYREGATGFLTVGTDEAPGNLGLHDTRLALRWVQEEIAHFGGDPTKVTVFGHSSGGSIVQHHFISSYSLGLFTRAISQSSSPFMESVHVQVSEAVYRTRLLSKAVGCDIRSNTSAMIHCLQQVDIEYIVGNQTIPLADLLIISGNSITFTPVYEDYLYAKEPFFSGPLDSMVNEGLHRAKPLILGFSIDEGMTKLLKTDGWLRVEENTGDFIPMEVLPGLDEDKKTILSRKIKDKYFGNARSQRDRIKAIIKLYSETNFQYPIMKLARLYASIAYGYLYAFNGDWNPNPEFFAQFNITGVGHGYELNYLFYREGQYDLTPTAANLPNLEIRDMMVELWTGFAKTGVPSSTWKTIAEDGYLVIDSVPRKISSSRFEDEYYNFWANVEAEACSPASLSSPLPLLAVSVAFILAARAHS